MTALFGWQFAMELEYRKADPPVTLDWDLPGFGRGFAVQVLLRYGSLLTSPRIWLTTAAS